MADADAAYVDIRNRFNAEAKILALEGRSGELWKRSKGTPERAAIDDDVIRWAFWIQDEAQRHRSRSDRESTDEAYFVSTLRAVIERARSDEKKRCGASIAAALRMTMGDEADSIVYSVADSMGMFDDE